MRVQHMREYVAIKEQGNFSRAARSLFMTQPALSRHIADMERELGVKLLERDKHSVEFTEPGLQAYRNFKQMLQIYDRLVEGISDYKMGLTGRLRIGMLYYTIRLDFGDMMDRFAEEYPNAELHRYSYQPQGMFQALADDRIDIGVLPYANYPDANYLCFQDIMSAPLDALMSTKHPLASRASLTLDDLRGETTLLLHDDPCMNYAYREILDRNGFELEHVAYTDNVDTAPLDLQKDRLFYFIPRTLPLPESEQDLVRVPIDAPDLTIVKSFAWRADNDNPFIPIFLDMAR